VRRVNKAGLDLIKGFEGLSLKPYLDAIGIPTIGYGITQYENNQRVSMQDTPISEERAIELLQFEIDKKSNAIETMVLIMLEVGHFSLRPY
jgi:lysozyme